MQLSENILMKSNTKLDGGYTFESASAPMKKTANEIRFTSQISTWSNRSTRTRSSSKVIPLFEKLSIQIANSKARRPTEDSSVDKYGAFIPIDCKTVLKGLVIGTIIGIIVLAIVIGIWLKPGLKSTTSTTTTTETTTTSTTSSSSSTSSTSTTSSSPSTTSSTTSSTTTTTSTTTTSTTTTTPAIKIVYSQSFSSGSTPSSQCTAWTAFVAQLTVLPYTLLTMNSTLDPVGVTVTTPSVIASIALALRTSISYGPTLSNGNSWAVGSCGGGYELSASGSICSCPSPGYIVRPCIGNSNFGGVNSATCSGPTQVMMVMFQ